MMKTNSIIAIEELHKKISEKLTEYRKFYIEQGTNMDNPVYGSEKEYSLNAIIYSVQNILSDVSYLVRSHNIFLSIYTYNERENIKNNLNQIFQHLHNRNHAYVVSHIEQLKSLLRIWNIRVDKRTLEGYNEELERTREIKANLDNDFDNLVDYAEKKVLFADEISKSGDLQKIISSLLYGDTVIIFDGYRDALIINTKGWRSRGVDEPKDERVLEGPRGL